MRTLFSWSLWALGQALRLPLEGVGASDGAIFAQLGTGLPPLQPGSCPFLCPSLSAAECILLAMVSMKLAFLKAGRPYRLTRPAPQWGDCTALAPASSQWGWDVTLSSLVVPGPQTPLSSGTGIRSRMTPWEGSNPLCACCLFDSYRSPV